MKKKILILGAAALVFLLALMFTLYPLIASSYSQRHQSEIHTQYQENVEKSGGHRHHPGPGKRGAI